MGQGTLLEKTLGERREDSDRKMKQTATLLHFLCITRGNSLV